MFRVHLLYIVHLVVGSVCGCVCSVCSVYDALGSRQCVCLWSVCSVYDRATGSVHRANKHKIEALRTRACFSFSFFPFLFACLKIEDWEHAFFCFLLFEDWELGRRPALNPWDYLTVLRVALYSWQLNIIRTHIAFQKFNWYFTICRSFNPTLWF